VSGYLRVADVADDLGASPRAVLRWIDRGAIEALRLTRVSTIEQRTITVEQPTLLGTAYCPNCGKRAQVHQRGVVDADG
jgi:hypothetical protein